MRYAPAHETLENDIEEQDGYCRGYEIPKESESRIFVFSKEAFSYKRVEHMSKMIQL